MPRSWRTAIAIGASAAVLLLGACGGDDDAPAGGSAVRGPGEVDIDGETVRFRSEDGDAVFELRDDGEVRVSGEEGETVLTHGDGTVLPERWPDELVLPDDIALTSASTMTADGQIRVNVTGDIQADPQVVHEDFTRRLEAAGFTVQGKSLQDEGGQVFATISATSGAEQAAVTITGSDGPVTVSIFLGLEP